MPFLAQDYLESSKWNKFLDNRCVYQYEPDEPTFFLCVFALLEIFGIDDMVLILTQFKITTTISILYSSD